MLDLIFGLSSLRTLIKNANERKVRLCTYIKKLLMSLNKKTQASVRDNEIDYVKLFVSVPIN